MQNKPSIASIVAAIILACGLTLMLTLAFLDRSEAEGFRIAPLMGGNCVFAQVNFSPDPILYCSADITQVEDALRRYRGMPLGDKTKR